MRSVCCVSLLISALVKDPIIRAHAHHDYYLTVCQSLEGGFCLGEESAPSVLVSQIVKSRVEVLLVVIVSEFHIDDNYGDNCNDDHVDVDKN